MIGPADGLGGVDGQAFRRVVGNLTSGVSVITTTVEGVRHGMTASSVTSLSLDPPMMLVCVNSSVPMSRSISSAGRFAVNVLDGSGASLAHQFATPSEDKFKDVDVVDVAGVPLLRGALARLVCDVEEEVSGGTHIIFLGRVIHAEAEHEGEPLAYFRGKFGRFEFATNDEAYRIARQRILAREYPPNSTIDLAELATTLGMDEAAAFFALTRLSDDGLVRRDVERGYVVVPIDAQLCDQVFDTRSCVEAGVIHMVLDSATDEELDRLADHLAVMTECIEGDVFVDFERYLEANYLFHLGLVRLAGNPTLEGAFRGLSLKAVMARSFGGTTKTSESFLLVQRDILEGLRRRDASAAISAVYRYSQLAKVRVREVLAEAGGAM